MRDSWLAIDLLPDADHVGLEARRRRAPGSTSSGLARWARSVPSVNTTSVPKRSGTGACSICCVSTRTPSMTAPFRLVDGSRGRRRRQRADAAADVAAEADHRGQVRAAVEGVDRHLLVGPDPVGERRRRLDQRRHVARIDDAAAHVDQQQRVVNRGHLGLQDGLLALQDRDRLLVLVDAEVLRRQVGDGLAVARLDGEVDRHVRRLAHRGVDQLQLEAGAPGRRDQDSAAHETDEYPEPFGFRIGPAYHETDERN